MAIVKGIDVHEGRGDVDWPRVRGKGIRFAYVKASEGLDWRDGFFGQGRWRAMREAKIIRGAYHYARPQPGRRGRDEAEFFLSVVEAAGGRRSGDLPLCLDIEWPACELSPRQIRAWCSDFCNTVKRETGRPCVTYTGHFWRERVGALGAPANGANLWLPAYGPNDGKTRIDPAEFVPSRFKLRMHQWTDRGSVAGVEHQPVDLNVWFGTLTALREFCRDPRAAPAPAPTPPAEPAPEPEPEPEPEPVDKPTAPMSTRDLQRALRSIGWPLQVDGNFGPKTAEAVTDFQRGYAFIKLRPNGNAGPQTRAAIRKCLERDGRCSRHFAFREFRSKGNGWIKVRRELVRGLERYRRAAGGPVAVVSGYRDPDHNEAVGGASQSQHLFANAADLVPVLPLAKVSALGIFSGIGFQSATGLVRHVDVRHLGPNTTGGTPSDPTVWIY